MAAPEWLDEALSSELPLLRDRGEGQHLEFMVRYPENGHELSREIAAFASSNAGTILIGVGDDGTLAGLEDVDSPEGRDRLCRRIEGVCSGNVRPAITPVVKFAMEAESVVLAIEVPRGSQPIYYSKNTPYVRHLSQSRPAEPHEVIERVGEWLKSNPLASAEEDPSSRFLSSLAATLIDVLIYGSEFEKRNVNPWLDLSRTQLGSAGEELRRLATDDTAIEKRLDDRLRSIADKLDAAAAHRLTLGKESWSTLLGYVTDAVREAAEIKKEHIDTVPLSDESRRDIADMISRSSRELADLDNRAEAMAEDGRVEDLQEAASSIGRSLLLVGHYRLDEPGGQFTDELRSVGHDLHLLETDRLYSDGGQSMRRIVERVHNLNHNLQTLLSASQL